MAAVVVVAVWVCYQVECIVLRWLSEQGVCGGER